MLKALGLRVWKPQSKVFSGRSHGRHFPCSRAEILLSCASVPGRLCILAQFQILGSPVWLVGFLGHWI